MAELRQMARKRRWVVKASRKADLADQIAEHMTRPDEVAKSVSSLDDDELRVLHALVLLGEAASDQSERVLPLARAIGHLGAFSSIEEYSLLVQDLGLALPGSVLYRFRAHGVFVPDALARALPPALAHLATDPSRMSVDEVQQSDSLGFLRAVIHVLLLLEHAPVPLRTPMPRPRIAREYPALQEWDYVANEVLEAEEAGQLGRSSDFELSVPAPRHPLPDTAIGRLAQIAGGEWRLEFVYELLVAMRVLQPGSPVTVWPEVKERFLGLGLSEQRTLLARAYFGLPNWSVLWQMLREQGTLRLVRHLSYGRMQPEHLARRLASYRQAVLRVLASLPERAWVPMSKLDEVMRIVWPAFGALGTPVAWSDRASGRWHLNDANTDEPIDPEDSHHWDRAQGTFVRTMLTGPLHWLGLVDLRWQDRELSAIQLHGLADIFWDRREVPTGAVVLDRPPEAMSARALLSVDDSRIRVDVSAVTAQAHGVLGNISRLIEADAERFVYKLDPRVAHHSFETGSTMADLCDGWAAVLPGAMPDVIRERLAAWWEGYGRTRVYTGTALVEFADDHALAEMRAVTSLDQVAIAEITPRAVIVPKEAVDQLVAELEAAGYTPSKTDET